ncbi:MAG: pantetheine-phosphate adenylyltransferase [Rhodospirillales bacterium]|nr:pantetheine-phosphate adenylyltransferase [Rhodospirillales bacterium]
MSERDGAMRAGVYPGTFDPVTNGHIDIIARAARIVPRLVVGVASNIGKAPIFSIEERVDLVRAEIEPVAARAGSVIEVRRFDGLLVAFARSVEARVIVRGLRVVADFDYEFQMAGMNYRLDPSIETVFLMASERHQFISSRFVREIAALGGDISSFVPPLVLARMLARVGSRGGSRKEEGSCIDAH